MAKLRNDWRREFEEKGEEYVRSARDVGKYTGSKLVTANQWLGQRERSRSRESDTRNVSSISEQIRIARSANKAAWMAAIAAIVAAVAAIISIWVSIKGA
jgi:hypothetical protein